jgi:peroxiredoxin
MKLLASLALLFFIQDKAELGKICPDIALKDLAGKEIKLSEFRKADGKDGSVVLIVFWSYKCPDGAGILPILKEKMPELDKQGIKFVGVCSYGEPEDKIKEFAEKNEIKYTLCYDNGLAAAKALGARVATAALVLDAEGKVQYIGGIFYGDNKDKYDGISAALDVKAGKSVKEAQVKAKG